LQHKAPADLCAALEDIESFSLASPVSLTVASMPTADRRTRKQNATRRRHSCQIFPRKWGGSDGMACSCISPSRLVELLFIGVPWCVPLAFSALPGLLDHEHELAVKKTQQVAGGHEADTRNAGRNVMRAWPRERTADYSLSPLPKSLRPRLPRGFLLATKVLAWFVLVPSCLTLGGLA